MQLRQAQLFSGSKLVHAWCFETILITNCSIFGSNEGITCALCTLKINHKYFVSMETAPPIVNKAVINTLCLQLFSKMRKLCRVELQHQLAHQCSPNIIGIWEWGICGLMGGAFIT